MDLRPYRLSAGQIKEATDYIRSHLLCYQPYIITETMEVGEGQNFHDGYDRNAIYGANIYCDQDIGLSIPLAKDLPHFRMCNADYRKLYESFADQIAAYFSGSMAQLTFSEIGTNSGLNLFNLAVRGAGRCIGYDWNDMSGVFKWLNTILGTKVEFRKAVWDRLYHKLEGAEHGEVDVTISTVVLNHQVDFLAHLAFLCDHAKKAVFLWVLTEDTDARDAADAAWEFKASKEYWISYTAPNALHPIAKKDWEGAPFPLCFDQGICISEPMLRRCLTYLGFEDIRPLQIPSVAPGWSKFTKSFKPFLAIRTRNTKSAYWKHG